MAPAFSGIVDAPTGATDFHWLQRGGLREGSCVRGVCACLCAREGAWVTLP